MDIDPFPSITGIMSLVDNLIELKKKPERSNGVISAEAMLITMMAFHGITLLIHVIFMLFENLETASRYKFAYIANWLAEVVGLFNTIFGYVTTNLVETQCPWRSQ